MMCPHCRGTKFVDIQADGIMHISAPCPTCKNKELQDKLDRIKEVHKKKFSEDRQWNRIEKLKKIGEILEGKE